MAAAPVLWVILGLQSICLVLVGWGWWQLHRQALRIDDSAEQDALRSMQRMVETRLDLILSQVLQLASAVSRWQEHQTIPEAEIPLISQENAALEGSLSAEVAAPFPPSAEEMPTFVDPRSFKPEERSNRLQSLLNDSEFLDTVWHQMDGPFDQAVRHVADYLVRNGMPEPQILPYPQISKSQLNHWRFMIVASAEPGSDYARVLIPRHYDRYDPSLHLQLFRLQGDPAAAERHLRELRRSTLLRAQGNLSQSIDPKDVLEKGIVVV